MDSTPQFSHYGPWAVIAGASEGTGAEFAHALAAGGLNVLLVARRQGPLESLAEQLRASHGREVRTVSVDLATETAAERIIAAAGDLEVGMFVANAGAEQGGADFLDQPLEAHLKLVELNVGTVLRAVHHFGRPMRDRGRGAILIMSSGTALGGHRGVAAYSGAKGFQLNFAESLWAELRSYGVHVLGVAAPPMATPMLKRMLDSRGVDVPGLYPPEEVVRIALEKLPGGASLAFDFNKGLEDAATVNARRRERIEALEALAARFGKPDTN